MNKPISNVIAKAKNTDRLGNVYTVMVKDNGSVLLHNQHRILMHLSTVTFMIVDGMGYESHAMQVKMTARKSKNSEELVANLKNLTMIDWEVA